MVAKESQTMTLYYFTKRQYALESLRDKRVKIARFNELNDPFDFVGIATINATDLETVRDVRAKLDKEKGLLCMSTTWQQPLLWGHYADSHKGMCLGFEVPTKLWKALTYRKSRPTLKEYGKKRVSQLSATELRGGSVCLNSFGRFAKWISASIMPPPSLVPAR
ncbi:hypothetical protein FHT93_005365, partial [Rhizobium sp. BK379]|nr:hypothetical protein [Rhizobium sp. BK379]